MTARRRAAKPAPRRAKRKPPAARPARLSRPSPSRPAPPPDVRFDVPASVLPLPAPTLRAAIRRAVRATGYPGLLSVAVVTDAAMRVLNRDFHACDEPTDVLAFDLGGPAPGAGQGTPSGEVVVSVDTARMEAEERGVTLASELLLYVVHGTLHLLGEDDHDPASYRRMHDRALSILAGLGHCNTIDPAAKKLRSGRSSERDR